MIATATSLVMPFTYVTLIIGGLTKVLIPEADHNFITYKYLPRLGLAVKDINLDAAAKADIVHKGLGMLIKILYAFLWQEFFVPLPFLYTSVPLHIGAWATVSINAFASNLSGFAQTDDDVVNGVNLYPGQAKCRVTSSHSLWHE